MGRVRRWWANLSRRGKIITGAIVAVLALALAAPQPDGTGGPSPSPSDRAAIPSKSAAPTADPSEAATAATGDATTPSPALTDEPTSEPTFDFEKPIPGLAAVDVTGNLVDLGFDCGDMEQTDSGVMYECLLSAPDAEQRVIVLGTTPANILLVDSTALDFGPNPGDSGKAFLQYMATVPCEGCDPEAAKAWVLNNFDEGGEQVVGGIILNLYGDVDSKILEIRAAP